MYNFVQHAITPINYSAYHLSVNFVQPDRKLQHISASTGIASVFSLTISLTQLLIVNKMFLTFDTIKCRYLSYSVDYLVFIIAVSSTLYDSNPSHSAIKTRLEFFLTGFFRSFSVVSVSKNWYTLSLLETAARLRAAA